MKDEIKGDSKMPSAILKMFGVNEVEAKPTPKAAVIRDRLAEAEERFKRAVFANALACASVNDEVRKMDSVCREAKKLTNHYDDRRKTEPLDPLEVDDPEWHDPDETVRCEPITLIERVA